MGQVSSKLRNIDGGFSHWCPGCGEMHVINTEDGHGAKWTFDGNLEIPTFSPSVKIWGKQTTKDAQGKWTGDWVRGPDGKALDYCCHYFLKNGQLQFLGDCTHALSGQTVPLPELPDWLKDQL